MDKNIQELLSKKAELQARINLFRLNGSLEIKENKSGKYIYIRRREFGRLKSEYIDKYSEEVYASLLKMVKETRALKKELREIEKLLALKGYSFGELSPTVRLNLDFARLNMKSNIYEQAVLEGVATTYPQTETIIENGKVNGVTAGDVQKILNLKHAWEFILDKDVILSKTDFYLLCYIAKLVNEGFYREGGRLRAVPVKIGGSEYIPPIPIESDVKEDIANIVDSEASAIEIAIELCLYCMKKQLFNDGNKRTAVIFANHFLIGRGKGLLVIPEKDVAKFKKLLVEYYEGRNEEIKEFMKNNCWRKF